MSLAAVKARHRLNGVTAVVLAGGRGTRLAQVIDNVPKPLAPVAGQPFIHWVTAWLIGQGVTDIVYSAGHLGAQLEAWVARLHLPEPYRAVCRRERSQLGTGGAILACLDLSQEIVLVLNGDTLLLTELEPCVSRLRTERLDGMVLAITVDDASRFGTLELGADGLLQSFREKQSGTGIVNAGVYLFPRAVLEPLLPVRPMSLEHDLVPDLLRTRARIAVAPVDAPFIDIGVPESFAMAGKFVAAHLPQIEGLAR